MPTTAHTTTRRRNDAIRAWAASNTRTWWSAAERADTTRYNCPEAAGLSRVTVGNILRGRDLNPPPSARRRRVVSASSSAALGTGRRFGVEIEFFGVSRVRVQNAIDSGAIPTGWRVKSDCSIRSNDRTSGLELVSPPLQGDAGLDSLRTACRWLRDNGAAVNSTCGLHVHHEARDLGAAGIARVARAYTDHQELINWLVAPSRRGACQYAAPMTNRDAEYIERSVDSYLSAPTRYLALNVQSFGRHGTVEFRQHQGTLNFRKIEAWIALGQGLCDAAAESTRISADGIRGLLSGLRVDEDSAAYLLGRAVQLGASSAQVAS